jgi:CBS domain-containing protein
MSERDESSIVIVDERLALVTDRDLREQVVAGDVSTDAPLSSLALSPAQTVRSDRLVLDAIVDMLEAGTEHLMVMDDDGALVGVLDHSAVLTLDVPNPLVVRQRIERASTVDGVAGAVSELPGVALRLLDASVEPLDILVVLATTSDAVARRLTELAVAELGSPPAAWAWLALGSEARREQTLATDQDNGLAFDGEGADVDEYFAAFAEHMNRWLARCGYAECRAGVMARNEGWRLTRGGWLDLLDAWLNTPTRHQVHVAMIGLDLRSVAGSLPIERDLHGLLETAPEHPRFLERLAGAATALGPPTGFLRELVVERSGGHVGTLDIKAGGVTPIVNLARYYALASGSAATSTVRRFRAAVARGSISEEAAQELHEAFVTINRVRLEHQAAQVERSATPDNHVDPRQLPPLARRQLKEAFRAIARAQRVLKPRTATRVP